MELVELIFVRGISLHVKFLYLILSARVVGSSEALIVFCTGILERGGLRVGQYSGL